MADVKTGKTASTEKKQTRNFGPRFMNLAHKIVDAEGNVVEGARLAEVEVVTNMDALVKALESGKRYSKVQLPARKPRSDAA